MSSPLGDITSAELGNVGSLTSTGGERSVDQEGKSSSTALRAQEPVFVGGDERSDRGGVARQGGASDAPANGAPAPRMARPSRVLRRALAVPWVVVLVAGIGLAVLTRTAPSGVPEILGHPVLKVLSGSMTPTFRTGDLIVDRPIGPSAAAALHVGEIATFAEPGSGGSVLVTHRIYRVLHSTASVGNARAVVYMTKGDANNAPDPWRVVPSEVVGLYQWRIPDGGYALRALESRWIFTLALVAATAWIFGGTFRRRWQQAAEDRNGSRTDT